MANPTMRAARKLAARDDGAALRLWAGAIERGDTAAALAVRDAGGATFARDARRLVELAGPLRAHVCTAIMARDGAATLDALRMTLRVVVELGELLDVPAVTLQRWRGMLADADARAVNDAAAVASMVRTVAAGVRYVRDVAGADALALTAALPAVPETALDPAAAADAWATIMRAAGPIIADGAAALDADPDGAAAEAERWHAIARQADA